MIVSDIYYGLQPVQRIYMGGRIVWEAVTGTRLYVSHLADIPLAQTAHATALSALLSMGGCDTDVEIVVSGADAALTANASEGARDARTVLNTAGRVSPLAASAALGGLACTETIPLTVSRAAVAVIKAEGAYQMTYLLRYSALRSGITAEAKPGSRSARWTVRTARLSAGICAQGVCGGYSMRHDAVFRRLSSAVAGEALSGAAGADAVVAVGLTVYGLPLAIAQGLRVSAESLVSAEDGFGNALDTLRLCSDCGQTAEAMADSALTSVAVRTANYQSGAVEESSLAGTGIRLVCGSGIIGCCVNTQTEAALGEPASVIYPVQTDTDLYIQQVYQAVQSGTELAL